MLSEKSCREFTELIASDAPAPGGGGVSAMTGAMAIALGDMVGEFSIGKKKTEEEKARLCELMKRAQEIRKRFLELIDEDAEKFIPLSEAYKIPKDAPGRDEKLESCLRLATEAPLEIFKLSVETIDILNEFGKLGSKLIISDYHTGLALAQAAKEGAAINVRVNTALMKDREYAERIESSLDGC